MKPSETEKSEAIKTLRAFGVKPGAKLYTSVAHVARSGMSRSISVYIVQQGEIRDLTGLVGRVLGYRRLKDGSLHVGGCGLDVGFAVVYNLGRAMFPKGGPLSKSSPGRQAQESRDGKTREVDGGYLLKQAWL